ncbi:ankyrin repeat domain-containing protein [Terrihabitans sp. B22-R8]|uniref:ankyrin repeat domain-containing protein n=1 Tax=Terrihabitans sp. B22-R8 TaxID=3425128 RepID=UPI00403D3F81
MLRKIGVILGALVALAGLGMVVGEPQEEVRTHAFRPELSEPGADGKTPLQKALLENDYGAFLGLLRDGADPNVRGWHGTTAIHLAAQHESTRYLEKLLEHGGDPNALARRLQQTPLFNALDARRPRNRDVLIKHGANIEHADTSGSRPLQHAAAIRDSESVLRLLALGADPTATSKIGATFQSSFFRGDPGIMTREGVGRRRTVIKLLEDRGIPLDPNAERFR